MGNEHTHRCGDCDKSIFHNHKNPEIEHQNLHCISCNFRRKRIRELGLLPQWPGTPEFETALDEMMKDGGPHIDEP